MLHPSIVSPCFPASPFVNANCIKSANHEALEWVSILWMRSCWINWIPETVTSMSPAVGWSPMNRHGPHGFQKRANVSHSLGCTMCLGYKKYPPGNQHIPSQGTSEDYFPLPVLVVYVSSLEGRRLWDALHLFLTSHILTETLLISNHIQFSNLQVLLSQERLADVKCINSHKIQNPEGLLRYSMSAV